MPNLFDLYTVPPKTDSFSMPMLAATGINSIDTDLNFDYSFTPKQPQESREDMFKQALLQVGRDTRNAPAYTFTESMAKRYDIPGLQYTPYKTALGTDIEDLYARNQEWYKQLGNGVVKGLANLGGTFASSFLTMPATLDLIRDGKYVEAFEDDSLFSSVQEMLTNMEEILPNYYSEWEREHPYLSAIPFGKGSANFYGDKIIKNLGFTAGSILAGMTQAAILTAVTGGLASELGVVKIGATVAKSFPKFVSAMKNTAKIAQSATATKNFGTMLRAGQNMEDAAKVSAGLVNLGKASKFITTSYLSAQGEAFIEGYHTYNDIRTEYYKKLLNNEIGLEEAENVERMAQDAGRYTTGINLVLLSLSNAVQFPKLLGGPAKNDFVEAFTKTILGKEGLQYAENYSLKKAALRVGQEFVKDSITEGWEEFSQAVTSGAITDYYMDKFSPAREGIVYHIGKQFEKEGAYEEAFIGAISGALMGGVSSVRENLINGKAKVRDAVNNLNRAMGKIDEHTRLIHSAVEENLSGTDKLKRQQSSFKYKFNLARQAVRYGTYDSLVQSFRDAGQLEVDEFNTLFDAGVKTKEEQVQKIEEVVRELDRYASIVNNVNTAYSDNPYRDESALSERLKKSLGANPNKLKSTQEYLFEEWKGAMAYSIARSQVLDENLEGIQTMMSTYGLGPESFEYLRRAAYGDKAVIPIYNQFKTNQINALLQEKQYLEQMQQTASAASPQGARPGDYQKKIQEIDAKIKSINKTLKNIKELSAQIPATIDPSREAEIKSIQDRLINEFFFAETSAVELDQRLKEAQAKDAAEAARAANAAQEEKDNLNKGIKDEGTKLAEEIITVEESVGDDVAPAQSVPIEEDPNAWINDFTIGSIVKITIIHAPNDFIVVSTAIYDSTTSEEDPFPPTVFLKLGNSDYIYELTKSPAGKYILSVDVSFTKNDKVLLIQKLLQLNFKLEGTVYSKEVTVELPSKPQEEAPVTSTTSKIEAESEQGDGVEETAKALDDKKADIERRRQEDLKAVPVGSSTMYKYVKDGANTELTEEEQNTAEELIQAFVEKGETDANKVISYLQRQGFIRGPYVSLDAQKAYIQARLNGTNIPVNGRVQESINAKYDAELAALQTTPASQATASQTKPQPAQQATSQQPAQQPAAPAQPATTASPTASAISSFTILDTLITTDSIENPNFLFVGPKTNKIVEGMPVYRYEESTGKVVRYKLLNDGAMKLITNQDNIPKTLKQIKRASNEAIYSPKAKVDPANIQAAIIQNIANFLGDKATEQNKAVLQTMAEKGLIEIQC